MKFIPRRITAALFVLACSAPLHAAETLPLWEAMNRALTANPAILSQQTEVRKQELEKQIAHSQHLPKIDLNAGYTHSAYPSMVTPIRRQGVFPPLDRDVANVGMALTLPLYTGGKLTAGESLAEQQRESASQALRGAGQDLLFNVTAAYTKALHLRDLGEALARRIRMLEQEEKSISLKIEQGRAARLDLMRLQTQLSQARHDQLTIRQGEQNAHMLLAALLGAKDKLPPLAELQQHDIPLPASLDEALEKARRQRPDILKLQAHTKAAAAKAGMARGDQLPQISLLGKVQETSGSDWQGYDDWQVGVQLSYPLFDGAIRNNRLQQANLERQQGQLLLDDGLNRLAYEVEEAFSGQAEARSRLRVSLQGEQEAEEALRIETLRYDNGESTITDLLAAEAALWSAQASRLQAGYDVTARQAQLLRAIGELSPDSFKPQRTGTQASGVQQLSFGKSLAPYLMLHRCAAECPSTPGALPTGAAHKTAGQPRLALLGAGLTDARTRAE